MDDRKNQLLSQKFWSTIPAKLANASKLKGIRMQVQEITQEIAAKVLRVVDAGLSHGVGEPIPGQMCVEAAVCYALGLPHGDNPQCVSNLLRSLKIRLNDTSWASNAERAKGLRRLA